MVTTSPLLGQITCGSSLSHHRTARDGAKTQNCKPNVGISLELDEKIIALNFTWKINMVAASTQNQALSAIMSLYKYVLQKEIVFPSDIIRVSKPERLPTVLSHAEAISVINNLSGVPQLITKLLYGSGLRITPALACRCKCGMYAPASQGH